MKRNLTLALPLVLAALAACQDVNQPTAVPGAEPLAAVNQAPPGKPVPDQYVVVLREGVTDVPGLARALAQAHGGTLRYTYEHSIRGFSLRIPDAAVQALRNHPDVAYVEQDQEVSIVQTTQPNATWGIDRTDQRFLPLDGNYIYDFDGTGVNVYILDTGISLTHTEFSGRLIGGFDAITPGGDSNDCHGHGTHVAGTAGGTTWGIAKRVRLSPVRVLNCGGSGTWDQVIAGVDWVTANHVKPAVANMSLGGAKHTPVDDAIRASISAGVTYVVAAGNSNANACNSSPSGVREALTVGATNSSDARASFSNHGECLDIFAPGVGITSAWHTSPTAIAVLDGTSMSSPHVAGVAALYLQANPTASATQVFSAIRDGSTKGIVTNAQSANNDLLYSRFITSGPPPTEFTLTVSGQREGNVKVINLVWAGATSANVDIFRDRALIITTANDGAHTDTTAPRGPGTHQYRVCEAGTRTCSNIASITF